MGVALSTDLGSFQNPGVAQLDHDLLLVKPVGLAVVVGLDTAHKVGLAGHHLGEQVHQGVLEKNVCWGFDNLRLCHQDLPKSHVFLS